TGQSCSGIRNCQAQVESQEVGEEEENQAFRVKEVKEGWGGIAELDADKDVTLVDVDDTDEEEPAEVEEVLEVVTVVKLMTEVVTTATPITTAAQAPKVIAPRRRMSVVIQDPEETAATSVIVHSKRMDEEAEELKRHLQIIPNDDDDVYTKATHLASKNFDREDLEALWKLVKERFESTEPKNFSDEFLLNTFKIMFEKPNIEANVWRDQKGRYGLAKMFLRVEKKIPLTHFTVEQMLNNVRLKVEEESEMSLEFLRLVRRQLNEGFGVDVVQDFKKNAKRLLLLVEELVLLVHIDVV
nr:hypothetical protein [Tanacetum cinerariifolium]